MGHWSPVSLKTRGLSERLWLLRRMGVMRPLVNLQFGRHLPAQTGLRQHALDRLFNDRLRAPVEQLDKRLFAESAGEAGIAPVELGVGLHAGEDNLFAVDDDNMVAHIEIGRVLHVVLAGEDVGSLRCQPAECLACCVQHEPLALDVLTARNGGGIVHKTSVYSLVLPSSLSARRVTEEMAR